MSSSIILVGAVIANRFGSSLISIFTDDEAVIANGTTMLRLFSYAYMAQPVIQTLNGALRGAGRSRVPMYFMLGSFVVLRQIYLMIAVPLTGSLAIVFAGWPITWVVCAIGMLIYYVKVDWLPKEQEA